MKFLALYGTDVGNVIACIEIEFQIFHFVYDNNNNNNNHEINEISLTFNAEGPFQSDALLVPEGCLFDHIHNASRCWPFVRWNQTGAAACQDRGMQMRSFAMLLPCGISLFSGVEFVCCPKHFKGEFDLFFTRFFFRFQFSSLNATVRWNCLFKVICGILHQPKFIATKMKMKMKCK